MMKLIRYDAARKALAEARRVDEVKSIRDKAVAMQIYAAQAKDPTLIEHATDIRTRAEQRAGEMLKEMRDRRERQAAGRPEKGNSKLPLSKAPNLKELGVSKMQASRWMRLADLDPKDFEAKVERAKRKAVNAVKGMSQLDRMELRREDEKRIKNLVPLEGQFRTLVIDPPWDYEWLSIGGASKPGYATMTHQQLLDLPVPAWATKECHLYLWTTNNFMTRACELMLHWGFDYKTILTWVKTDKKGKPKIGLGTYFRNTTEHVLFGCRGKLRTRVSTTPTHFFAPVGRHSEKPEVFYDIVRKESYLPAGEAFQREDRKGFVNLFVNKTLLQAAE